MRLAQAGAPVKLRERAVEARKVRQISPFQDIEIASAHIIPATEPFTVTILTPR